MDSKNSLLANI